MSDHPIDATNAGADELRTTLLGVCYRLLGSTADAEDAVQETYLRWLRLSPDQRDEIESPSAWMVRVASRVSLDMLGSARHRRERYVGEWLPEPVPSASRWSSHHAAPAGDDPADRVTLDESVSMALMVVLESMTPAERVAFVLHDVFRYSFADIAAIVGRSPAATRQLATSARRRLTSTVERSRTPADTVDVVVAFKHAWESGDLDTLVSLLDPSVTATTDGGGLVTAPIEPILGADAVARMLADVLQRQPDLTLTVESINGAPGVVARSGSDLRAVVSLAVADGAITQLWAMRNPHKLRAWTS